MYKTLSHVVVGRGLGLCTVCSTQRSSLRGYRVRSSSRALSTLSCNDKSSRSGERHVFWKKPPKAAMLVWTHRRERNVDLLRHVVRYCLLVVSTVTAVT